MQELFDAADVDGTGSLEYGECRLPSGADFAPAQAASPQPPAPSALATPSPRANSRSLHPLPRSLLTYKRARCGAWLQPHALPQ